MLVAPHLEVVTGPSHLTPVFSLQLVQNLKAPVDLVDRHLLLLMLSPLVTSVNNLLLHQAPNLLAVTEANLLVATEVTHQEATVVIHQEDMEVTHQEVMVVIHLEATMVTLQAATVAILLAATVVILLAATVVTPLEDMVANHQDMESNLHPVLAHNPQVATVTLREAMVETLMTKLQGTSAASQPVTMANLQVDSEVSRLMALVARVVV